MNEDDEDTTFHVNYAKVLDQKDMLPVTRLLAADLLSTPYMPVGDFIAGLSDASLAELIEVCNDENHPHFEELLLIAEMLSAAEGLESGTLDTIHERTNHLITLIAIESLARKGLVKVHHKNMSFGEDMGDKVIVEKLDD
jgi:hypothetical protein